ncbi:capsular polysaccharide export protein [Sphingomonas vulcanisoli]|uniref:Capsular polysaccharide export protein n=1 Tax=Sphingomonas vulcanisoli TaxID=1658060 RepID=A0ABX0TY65_9SPHN|nr:capsular biosynthesis protein [Sphingomonas vulcanisoli]NIJ08576.1 capsular polysaccharide export protein [Sphingomonas vulcanisoli]
MGGQDTRPGSAGDGEQRRFLFLQGLAGPFFSLLGRRLAEHGHAVHRINFNGGDRVYWRQGHATDYRGNLDRWPSFFSRFIQARGITDLVLFGDCRPLHKVAIGIAKNAGLQIHVFEEGYIRPDFVTVERGGVNGHSSLWRDPDAYLQAARSLPPLPEFPGVPSSFGRRAREDVIYNLSAIALRPLFPGYKTHRPWSIVTEYAGWIRRLIGAKGAALRSRAVLDRVQASGKRYFIFPLQLDDDSQIRVHSHYGGIQPAIDEVLDSFAAHAPEDVLLLVKGHPLDNGLIDWGDRIRDGAARRGIADRVPYVEEGDIDQIVRGAAGLVTVNSTTGTLSLRHGVPTIVLGHAVYDVPRITHSGPLSRFWASPQPPETEVFDAFRRVLIDRCLVHGGYFSDEGLEMLVSGSAARIEAAAPGAVQVRATAAKPEIRTAIGRAAPARG